MTGPTPPPAGPGERDPAAPEDGDPDYLPPEDREIIAANYTPPTPVLQGGETCARCGAPASKWMMASADAEPAFLCGRWPYCPPKESGARYHL